MADGRKLNLVITTPENFADEVRKSQAVYLRGGQTPQLRQALERYENLQSLFAGKTIAGSSAGAYVLAAHYFSAEGINDGFGLVPANVVCHFESEVPNHPGVGRSAADAAEIRRRYPDLETIVLRDYETMVRTDQPK